MAIAFQCPHCQKAYKVKDELAGKKVSCKQCNQVIVVPAAPVAAPADSHALEALATAALTADEQAHAAAVAAGAPPAVGEGPIPFDCPYCFEHVEFAAAQAGRKAPCPSCRRIVTVPAPKVEKPKDWRSLDERPTLARVDTGPAPEGAWGNTQNLSSVVSRDALLEAEVILDRKALAAPKRGKLYATLGVLALVCLGIGWWMRGRQVADDRRVSLITDALKAADPKAQPPLPAGWAAAIHCAAGEFYLREEPPDVKSAVRHLALARNAARNLESAPDRSGVLLEILLVQADLVGDDPKRHSTWEDSQGELRRTLNLFQELPREYGWLALETLTRKLRSAGPKKPMMMALASDAVTNEAEGLAVVALALISVNDPAAETVAARAQAVISGPASPRLAALFIARKQATQAKSLMGDPGSGDPPLPYRLAFADGYARTGDPADFDRAKAEAFKSGSPEDQVCACAMLADAAADSNAPDRLVELVGFVNKQGQKFTLPIWAVDRLGRACRRAGRADLAHELADESKLLAVKPWLELAALRAELDASAKPVDNSRAEQVGKQTVAQGLAWIAIARHNAKVTSGDPRAAWEKEAASGVGFAGAALGLQDRRSK